MTKMIVVCGLAGLIVAGAWFYHAPSLSQNGAVSAARAQAEVERLKVKQRLLAVEEVRERQKSALLVANLQKEQLAAQTSARIDNAPEVVAARIRSRVMAASWPFYALFSVSAAAIGVLAFAAIRRVPFRAGDIETFVSRRQAACLAAQSIYLQGLNEQTRAAAFMDETLRERVTAGLNVFAGFARTVRAATHAAAAAALPEQTQPALPAAGVVSFADMLQHGKFDAGKPLLFGFSANGRARQGSWADCYSLGIGGQSGYGKSNTIRLIMAESLLTGAVGQFFVIDPHFPHDESLLASLGALIDAPQVDYADGKRDAPRILQAVNAEIDRRLAENISAPVSVLIIDELMKAINEIKGVAEIVEKIGTESRKTGIYGIFAAQSWNSDKTGGTTGRDNLTALIIHNMKRGQANTLLQDKDLARQVSRLETGQAMFIPAHGQPEILSIPFASRDDMSLVTRRLGAGVSQDGAQTTQAVSASVDTGADSDAPERNVGADVIDFAARREQRYQPVTDRHGLTQPVTTVTQPDTADNTGDTQLLASALECCENDRKALAERSGVSLSLIKEIQAGRRRVTDDTRQKLETVLHVSN